MSVEIGVAVAQFAPGDDPRANLLAIESLTRDAAARGASLVVFPEYSSVFAHPVDQRMLAAAEPLDGPFVTGLLALARALGVTIVAGVVERIAETGRFSNTLVAVGTAPGDEHPRVLATYRKLHLYDAFGGRESDWVAAGDVGAPETFDVGGFSVGLQTCYDLRFPEVSRRLVDAGAEIIAVPAEWVRGPLKEFHWRTLATARAIENTVYLLGADHSPPIGVGSSLVLDPAGVALAALGDGDGVAVAWVSRGRLDAVRTQNPALALRRFGVHPLDSD